MATRKLFVASIGAVLLAAAVGRAAEKSASRPDTALRMTIILSEYESGKKLTSLPYALPCTASARGAQYSVLQMGVRVPIKVKQDEVEFEDVGTHVDCQASFADEQRAFTLTLGVKYNTVYSPRMNSDKGIVWHPGEPLAQDPIFGGFSANVRGLLMRDGQTVQVAAATDPVSGHVWKVDATLKVVK